jgi:predicted dehydrogenase
MWMNKILVIGAGNIGSRHLQSLARSEVPLEITVVDPSAQALETSRQRFDEVAKLGSAHRPKYCKDIIDAGMEFDIGIVATTSDIRRKVVEELLDRRRVKYLILEKVAFQNARDFEHVIGLLSSRGVKAWVNFPRRVIPFYVEMKKAIKPHEQVFYTVQGGDWSLACNAIHFIDHLCFMVEETDYGVSCLSLDKEVKESKRKGFIEFTGSLHCHFRNGSELNLISQNNSQRPSVITILSKSILYVIEEEKGLARVSREEAGWVWEEMKFKLYYQSELTHRLVEEIIETGNCGLTSIEESYLIHKPLLQSLAEHLEKLTGKRYSSCPIT